MKRLLSGFAVTMILTGCSAVPETEYVSSGSVLSEPEPQQGKYAVQIVEIENASGLTWDMLTKGMPSEETLKLEPVIDLFNQGKAWTPGATKNPTPAGPATISMVDPAALEQLADSPGAKVTAYPTLYAGLGETVISDQTEAMEVLKDVEIVNGQTVKIMENVKLGRYAEVEITDVRDTTATCRINFFNRRLAGTDTHLLDNGDEVTFTYFNCHASKTMTSQSTGSWRVMGALTEQAESDGSTESNSWACFVRILPPEA